MWEHFIEELLSAWAYLSSNPKDKRKLLEDKDQARGDRDKRA